MAILTISREYRSGSADATHPAPCAAAVQVALGPKVTLSTERTIGVAAGPCLRAKSSNSAFSSGVRPPSQSFSYFVTQVESASPSLLVASSMYGLAYCAGEVSHFTAIADSERRALVLFSTPVPAAFGVTDLTCVVNEASIGDGAHVTAQRQALLDFCVQFQTCHEDVPAIMAQLLSTLPVIDLVVEDPPIEAVMDQIYQEGAV